MFYVGQYIKKVKLIKKVSGLSSLTNDRVATSQKLLSMLITLYLAQHLITFDI